MSASCDRIPASQALVVGLDRWLRLRWWLAPAQVLVIAAAGSIPTGVPLWSIAILFLLTSLPGLAARRWIHRRDSRALLAGLILADLGLLTVTLGFFGGPANPFSILYLVYVTLACVLLGPTYGWISMAVAAVLYASLFLLSPRGDCHGAGAGDGAGALERHLGTMYFAFVAVAVLVVTFVSSVARTLRKREADLAEAKARAERNERLANVMVLAAGTAHEMGTPLATIAVTAKEMERAAVELQQGQWADDARLIRSEVERCRRLLDELRGQAGTVEGEAPTSMRLGEAVSAVVAGLPEKVRHQVTMANHAAATRLFLPRAAFERVLGNVVRNALEASQPDGPVVVEASACGHTVAVSVTDRGRGMTEEILGHAREPFFTTKPAGSGLGLGLFLADKFTRDVGGSLALESRPGHGTRVRLEFPA